MKMTQKEALKQLKNVFDAICDGLEQAEEVLYDHGCAANINAAKELLGIDEETGEWTGRITLTVKSKAA